MSETVKRWFKRPAEIYSTVHENTIRYWQSRGFIECDESGEPLAPDANEEKMQLQVGKRYRRRDGKIAYVTRENNDGGSPFGKFEGSDGGAWRSDGKCCSDSECQWDLIEELPDQSLASSASGPSEPNMTYGQDFQLMLDAANRRIERLCQAKDELHDARFAEARKVDELSAALAAAVKRAEDAEAEVERLSKELRDRYEQDVLERNEEIASAPPASPHIKGYRGVDAMTALGGKTNEQCQQAPSVEEIVAGLRQRIETLTHERNEQRLSQTQRTTR